MKEILNRLEAAIKASNAADEAWENDPESVEAEAEFQRTYEVEYSIRRELAKAITDLTNEIDADTALKMTYNPKLAELIGMMA